MIRVGIIGAGFGTIGLLPAFTGIPGCTVVGVCSKRDEWQDFLQRDDLDGVAIAVPPNAQHEIAKAAIARGIHVFAEKPLATNVADARELLALAQDKGIVHGIDLMFPDIAAWEKVREMLEEKTYGNLKHVSSRWEWLSGDLREGRDTWRTDVSAGGGALAFYFTHELYALERFAGKIRDAKGTLVFAAESKNGGEVGADVSLSFENGATGEAHISCNSPETIRHEFTFTCEKATIELKSENAIVDGFTVSVTGPEGSTLIPVKVDVDLPGEDERVKIVRKLARRFVAACADGPVMYPDFADGVRTHELIERIRAERIK